jgi:antitoxin (DNA-binding transcriptional repressor) of toxin-antitoxin stability system
MKTMGVKELKVHLSEVLLEMEVTGQGISVSNRGRLVARLVPMRAAPDDKHDPRATIASLDELATLLSANVSADVSVEDVINDIRR